MKMRRKGSCADTQIWAVILLIALTCRDFAMVQARVGTRTANASAPITGHQRHSGFLDEDPFMRMKVYVYDMPSRFTKKVVQNDMRCLMHMFSIEIHMHLFLLSSEMRTLDPEEADWFYTPVYTNCDLTTTGLPFVKYMPRMMRSAIQYISAEWPYWNRTDGADHFFVVPHDFGACFHYHEKEAIMRGIFPLLQRATLVQTFGQKNHSCFRDDSIIIPPYIPPRQVARHALRANPPRSTFVYFRGAFSDVDGPQGDYYARGVRAAIWEMYMNNSLFDISSEHPVTYYEDMQRSMFCLCPLGWAPWSPRIVEAVVFGCIPVIIADNIVLPFRDVIPWRDMGVFVSEKDVKNLEHTLTTITIEEVTRKQRMLSSMLVKQALLFPRRSVPGDAFHQVMSALARKLPHNSNIYLKDGQSTTLNWSVGNSSEFIPWEI